MHTIARSKFSVFVTGILCVDHRNAKLPIGSPWTCLFLISADCVTAIDLGFVWERDGSAFKSKLFLFL